MAALSSSPAFGILGVLWSEPPIALVRRMPALSPKVCKPSFKIAFLWRASWLQVLPPRGDKSRGGDFWGAIDCPVPNFTITRKRPRGALPAPPSAPPLQPASFCLLCCLISDRSPLYKAAKTDAHDGNLAGKSAPSSLTYCSL